MPERHDPKCFVERDARIDAALAFLGFLGQADRQLLHSQHKVLVPLTTVVIRALVPITIVSVNHSTLEVQEFEFEWTLYLIARRSFHDLEVKSATFPLIFDRDGVVARVGVWFVFF